MGAIGALYDLGGVYGLPLPPPKLAVDLFMIISGYLMAANAFARNSFEPLNSKRNWLRFWLRRFFRLAPAYYVSLLLVVITSCYFLAGYEFLQSLNPEQWQAGSATDPDRIKYTATNILLHISFLFGLHPSYSFSTFLPDWSLSLEMQFYFIFPALYMLMSKYGFIKITITVGLPIFILGNFIAINFNYLEPSLIVIKLNYFIAGVLVFRFLLESKKRKFSMHHMFLVFSAITMVSIEHTAEHWVLVLQQFPLNG